MAIYRRKNRDGSLAPTFHADFQYKGVRVSKDTGCTTRAAAKNWVREKKREIDEQLANAPRSPDAYMTLSEAFAKFWEQHLKHTSDAYNEQVRIKHILRLIGGEKRLLDLRSSDVADYISARLSEGVKKSTANREVHVLQAMHNHAIGVWELDLRHIAWHKIKPDEDDADVRIPLTVPELHNFMAAATPRLRKAIMFALLTGLRHAEVYSLQWKQVVWTHQAISFRGKGKKAVLFPISKAALHLLLAMANGRDPKELSGLIFDHTNYRREFDAARKAIGKPKTDFHSLRHAFATMLKGAGVPDDTVSKALRHSDPKTSQRYIHAEDPLLRDAMEVAARRLLTHEAA